MGLEDANSAVAAALRVVESSDREVPSQALAVFGESDQAMKRAVEEWDKLKAVRLPQVNDRLKQRNLPPIPIAEIEREVEYLMSR